MIMQSGKLITGLAIGAVAALILIPKTRKMLYNAACGLTDSLKGFADDAMQAAEKGGEEINKFAEKASDAANAIKETRHAWS